MFHRSPLILACFALPLVVTVTSRSARAGDELAFSQQVFLDNREWNNPTSVAVDHLGNVHVAYMTQHDTESPTKEIWYARQNAGATSWTHTRVTNNAVREEFPHLVLDRCDNVHIAFHTGTATSNMIRYVNNLGLRPNQFNPIIDITGSGFKIVKHAVDSTGKVHFVFTSQTTNLTDEVFYTTWTSGGGVSAMANLSNSAGSEADPSIAIDSGDHVHIAWADGAISGPMVYMNDRTGSLQVVATSAAGSVQAPVPLIGPDDEVNIVYRIGDGMWAINENTPGVGGGFTAPSAVYPSGQYRPAFYNKFAIDELGRRYVVFASNITTFHPAGTYIVTEDKGGFNAPQPLTSGATGNQGVSVALNDAGKLVVTYSISGFDAKLDVVYADMTAATATVSGLNTCPADTNDSGAVDVDDLVAVILGWGACDANCPPACAADINRSAAVDVDDLVAVILGWGGCP